MDLRETDRLLEGLEALPAARPLLERLPDGQHLWVVGGAVRDLLLGGEPVDLDLVVEGDPEPIVRRLGAPARVHDRFATATVSLDGVSYDFARARRESYARPGALPEVVPASIEEDLARRDFTVNALALGLGGRRRGELVAFPGALSDLRGATLRVLHEVSFIDDPTRLLRLARYAARLGFSADDHTLALAGAAVRGGALDTVSGPRLGSELVLLIDEDDPVGALGQLRALELDRALATDFGLLDPKAAEQALELLPAGGDRGAVALGAASMRMAPKDLSQRLDRLGFEAGRRDLIVIVAGRARSLAAALAGASRPSEIAAAVGAGPPELVALAGALGPVQAATAWLDELRHVELEIGGHDLLAAGVAAGPMIGAGLRAARAAKLDGEAHGRGSELSHALRAAQTSG